MTSAIRAIAKGISRVSESPWALAAAIIATLLWLASGPFFGWSPTWNFLANTTTTVITFIMVFAIQHSQSTDTKAIQKKLDELLVATEGARDELAGIEQRDVDEWKGL